MDRPVTAAVPCHGWTPPGYPVNARSYPGELAAGGGDPCPAASHPASPYPSPPLSTHGRPSSRADLRWSPVSQLGAADDSWSCAGDLTAGNQLRSPLPVDLVVSGDVMSGDFDLGQNSGRQSALAAYTGIYVLMF